MYCDLYSFWGFFEINLVGFLNSNWVFFMLQNASNVKCCPVPYLQHILYQCHGEKRCWSGPNFFLVLTKIMFGYKMKKNSCQENFGLVYPREY